MTDNVSFRRVTSTPTAIAVTATGLPSWLPQQGYWANNVSLNTTNQVTAASGVWAAGRSLDSLFTNYTGAVWNPYYGEKGAWLIFGNGHSTITNRLENTVYAWDANNRVWLPLSTPTYPGTIGADYWPGGTYGGAGNGESMSAYPSPFNPYGELAEGIPSSNHSRYTLHILPPDKGGGTYGSLISTELAALHVSSGALSFTAHRFDINSPTSGTWSRIGPKNTNASIYGRAWSGCVDTTRGRVIQYSLQGMWWIDPSNPAAWSARLNPPGFEGSGFDNTRPMIYIPSLDVFVIKKNVDHAIVVFSADEFYSNTVPRLSTFASLGRSLTTGTPPSSSLSQESSGMTWCPDLGDHGALVCVDYATAGYPVRVLYAPSDPIFGTWTWGTLQSNNSPAFSWAGFDNVGGTMYSRFQYAPALKSFFVASTASGNMWCFRPAEITG